MDKSEIEKLAELSKINISEEEKDSFATEIQDILGFVSEISEVKGASTESEAPEHRNVLREDDNAHESGVYTEEVLREAPDEEDGYVKVKKIL